MTKQRSNLATLDEVANLLCEGKSNAEIAANLFLLLADQGLVRIKESGEGFERITPRTVMVGPSSREESQISLTIHNMDGVIQETLILDGTIGKAVVSLDSDRSMSINIEWRGYRRYEIK